jgi:3-hydroxyisobutyrate dehydrogenase-like beta-hydroxyacid dehydrogenase
MENRRIGFIGLGNMGSRMTKSMVRKGQEVLGFDANSEVIANSGAKPVASIEELVKNSDVVLLSLPDSKIVEKVMCGENGAISKARLGQIFVDLSTASPKSTRSISALLGEKGAHYLDAGISGGAAAAEAGTLTLMVGGEVLILESVKSILELFATNIFHLGEIGTGHVAKILNNFLNAIALSATAEVMVAGKKAGLDLEVLLEVLNKSSGVNFATQNRFPKIIKGDYLKGGLSNTLMMKDVVLYTDLVSELGVVSLNASAPLASFGLAKALGYADEISNTVVDAIGDISGGIRIQVEKKEVAK